jgi:hypothetical protein
MASRPRSALPRGEQVRAAAMRIKSDLVELRLTMLWPPVTEHLAAPRDETPRIGKLQYLKVPFRSGYNS